VDTGKVDVVSRSRVRTSRQGFVGLILVALLPSTIRAELLYFVKGGRVQAAAETRGETVRLETPDGPIEFHQSDFRKIVPGHWPERDWPARRAKALEGDAAARYAAAWWALENGLTPQAEFMLRAAHEADSGHQPTARMVELLNRLDRPCDDPDLDRFRAALGQSFDVARGPHVVLFHQHGEADVRERLELLERVGRSFFLLMASRGVDLPVPSRRLVSAWFGDQRDYQAFLQANHASVFRSTRGYFHPTFRAVVAFDARSAKDQRDARDTLAARRKELDRLETAIDGMPPRGRLRIGFTGEPTRTLNRTEARDALARFRREVARSQLILDLDRRSVDLGTAAHELIHQLVAVTGFLPEQDDAPRWLHEGFAAQFEVIRGGCWAGISRAHDLRLPDWRAIKAQPQLFPLLGDVGLTHGYDRDAYAEAWGLVYFLRQRRPDAFIAFLDLLRGTDPGMARGSERNRKHFQTAFGEDLEATEKDWREFLGGVQTPLEEFDEQPAGKAAIPKSR